MEGFNRGTRVQAEITGWLLVVAVKSAVLVVRGGWWLLTRHPFVVLGTVGFALLHGWSRDSGDRMLVNAVLVALLVWGVLHAARHRPARGRRWRRIPAYYLRRPDVQSWVQARLREGHSRRAVAEALGLWSELYAPAGQMAEPEPVGNVRRRSHRGRRQWSGIRRRVEGARERLGMTP